MLLANVCTISRSAAASESDEPLASAVEWKLHFYAS